MRLGQLVADFDRIAELDINPLIAGPADQRQFRGRRAASGWRKRIPDRTGECSWIAMKSKNAW